MMPTTLEKLEADEKAARDKLEKDAADKRAALAEKIESERLAEEKAAADKKAKEEEHAAKLAAEHEARIAANPTSAALAGVAKALRGQGPFNDRSTAAAFANVADQLDAQANAVAGTGRAKHSEK